MLLAAFRHLNSIWDTPLGAHGHSRVVLIRHPVSPHPPDFEPSEGQRTTKCADRSRAEDIPSGLSSPATSPCVDVATVARSLPAHDLAERRVVYRGLRQGWWRCMQHSKRLCASPDDDACEENTPMFLNSDVVGIQRWLSYSLLGPYAILVVFPCRVPFAYCHR